MSSKTTLASALLIAALPAAILGYFLVSAFLVSPGLNRLGTSFMVLYAATLLVCAGVVFLPIGVMIFGPKPAGTATDAAERGDRGSEKKPQAAEESFSDELSELESEDRATAASTGELEIVDASLSQGDLEVVDAGDSEHDAFSDDDFSLDEEAPPKEEEVAPPRCGPRR